MSLLAKACSSCSVCWKTSTASHPRVLGTWIPNSSVDPKILFIDDMPHEVPAGWGPHITMPYQWFYWDKIREVRAACDFLTDGLPYVYTQAIRCESEVLKDTDINPAVACGVWTHNLTANRSLIITGKLGFGQMKLDVARYEDYKLYRSARLGIVFTLPPINTLGTHLKEAATRLSRALKEAGLK